MPEWSGPDYGQHADLTKVLTALRSDNPVAALHNVYPWMLDTNADDWLRARIDFVNAAVPLENAADHGQLQVLAERFIHAAMTERDRRAVRTVDRLGWTRVEVAWLVLFGLLAVALVVGAVLST